MTSYGITFKQLRENKKLNKIAVSQGIIPLDLLIEFEKNKVNISFSLLLELLERISVSMNEFLLFHSLHKTKTSPQDFLDSSQEKFWKEFVKVYYTEDLERISYLNKHAENFYQLEAHPRHKHNAILLKQLSLLNQNKPFSDKHITELKNYLLDIDIWGIYELTLFNNSLFFLPIEVTEKLGHAAMLKSKPFLKLEENKSYYYAIMLNVISILIENDLIHSAKSYIETFERELFNSTAYFYQLRLSFLKGVLHIKTGRVALGKKICIEAIQFSKIYDQSLGVGMQNELVDILGNQKAQ